MPTGTLEDRVTAVENELARLKQQLEMANPQATTARWENIVGTFADSEGFEEAVRLGREYRESLRPKEDEEAD